MTEIARVIELDPIASEPEVVAPRVLDRAAALAELEDIPRRLEQIRAGRSKPPEAQATPILALPRKLPLPARDFDDQLEWLIRSGDAAMGCRGTLAGVVSQIERGSVGGTGNLDENGCYKHPYTDLQLGAGDLGIGEVEIHRHLTSAWRLVSSAAQLTLCKRYVAPRAEFRADQGFGAKDRYVEGSDGRTGQHNPTRTGVQDILGEYAALAFDLCDNAAHLLLACVEPYPIRKGKPNNGETERRRKIVAEALRRAQEANAYAHGEWFAAKASVPGARSFQERTGRARCHLPTGARQGGQGRRGGVLMRMSEAAFAEAMERGLAAAQAAE